jgi:HemY protein
MIRVLIAIAVVFLAVLGLDALGTIPIDIAITWPGHAMSPSPRVVAVGLLVFAALAIMAWSVVMVVLRGPSAISGFFRGRRRDRGYAALSRGMIAIGSGDIRLAHRYADEARRLLPAEPLVMLLEAQTAQMEGRADAARGTFQRMLEAPETRLLGLRGLFIEANRAGDPEAARQFAAEAQRMSPGLPWAGTAVIENQSADHDWAGALATLDQNAAARLVDKDEARRQRAVLLTARALEVEDPDPAAARNYALEAHRLAPDLVPAAVVAARVLTRLQDTRKAAKVIEAAWKEAPHPELADAYLHVRPGDSTHDRLKRARALQSIRPSEVEGVLAVATAALDAGEFALARESLAKALRQAPTRRVCLMMADLEETETGDPGRVREWLGRAVRAPADAAWTADGVVSETWQPVSPVTGRLDAFEWRVPVNADSGATELDGSDLAERAIRPLEPPRPAPDRIVPAPAPPLTVHDADAAVTSPAPHHPTPLPKGFVDPVIFVGTPGATGGSPDRSAKERGGPGAAPASDPVVGTTRVDAAASAATEPATKPATASPEPPAPVRVAAVPPEIRKAEDPIPFRPDDPGPHEDRQPPAPRPAVAAMN